MDQKDVNNTILDNLKDIKDKLVSHELWRAKAEEDFLDYKNADKSWKKWVLRFILIIGGFTLMSILQLYGFWELFLDIADDAGKVIP